MEDIKNFLKSKPVVTIFLVAANVLVYAVLEMLGDTEDVEFMLEHGACYTPYVVGYGKYYLLFTSMFLHFGLEHLFSNMLVLLFLGNTLEEKIGKIRFLLIYLLGGVAGNVISVAVELQRADFYVSAGASGAVFALIGGLCWLVVKNKGKLDEISAERMGLLIVLSVFEAFTESGIDGSAHIGGMITGFILCALLTIKMRTQK